MEFEQAVELLAAGGALVYPTETYYGLGCLATDSAAMARVCAIKERPLGRPLPLVVGSLDQLALASPEAAEEAGDPSSLVGRIARRFWPGPLTLLLPPAPGLAEQALGLDKLIALRITSHPVAARLCEALGAPLAATSANFSGCNPAARPQDLDPELLKRVDNAFLDEPPLPSGGAPSTLAVPDQRAFGVWILRHGAVSEAQLRAAGVGVLKSELFF